MKLIATLAAAAAVCLTLLPQDASAQRRAGYRTGTFGVRTVSLRAPLAYRAAYRGAAYRTAGLGYRYGYRSYRYRPYWGWGAGAAFASAAYATTAYSPYYAYASYDDDYDNYPRTYRYSYPVTYSYSSCGNTLRWVNTRWGIRRAWVSRCW